MYELTEASVEVSSRPVNPPHPSSSTSTASVVRSSPQVTPSSPLWPEHSPIAHLPFSAPSLPAIGYIETISYLSAYSLKHIVRTSLTPPTTPRSLPQAINHPPPTRLDSTRLNPAPHTVTHFTPPHYSIIQSPAKTSLQSRPQTRNCTLCVVDQQHLQCHLRDRCDDPPPPRPDSSADHRPHRGA